MTVEVFSLSQSRNVPITTKNVNLSLADVKAAGK